MDVRGRNALVTGAGTRVGRGIALALADAGANVFVHYNRSADAAKETAEQVRSRGVAAALGSANLGDPESAEDLMEAATVALGPITLLVNSASGFPRDTIRDVTLEGWRRTLDLSLASPAFLIKAFANALPGGEQGAVVNVTDMRTLRPYADHLSYIVAKGGLDTLTRAAARQLGPEIRVNAVALGIILPPPGEDEAYAERLAERLPLRRVGGVEVVAHAVVALAENDFITGEIVRVDGGGHLV